MVAKTPPSKRLALVPPINDKKAQQGPAIVFHNFSEIPIGEAELTSLELHMGDILASLIAANDIEKA
jgi:hypothetical protein